MQSTGKLASARTLSVGGEGRLSEVDDIGAGVSRDDGECGADEGTSDQHSSRTSVHAAVAVTFDQFEGVEMKSRGW